MGTKYCVKSVMICLMTIISSNQTKTNIDSRKLTPSKVHKNTLDDKKDNFNDKQLQLLALGDTGAILEPL